MANKLLQKTRRLLQDEDGPTTVEYSVMIMIIILGCVFGARIIGELSNEAFQKTSLGINQAVEQNRRE